MTFQAGTMPVKATIISIYTYRFRHAIQYSTFDKCPDKDPKNAQTAPRQFHPTWKCGMDQNADSNTFFSVFADA